MSLVKEPKLVAFAKQISRDLRKNQTEAESILWNELRNRKLEKKFYRQYAIFYDLTGVEKFFIADFYCHENKLIIELDGQIHKFKLKADKERTKTLNYLGIKVIRFNNEEVITNLSGVLQKIKEHL